MKTKPSRARKTSALVTRVYEYGLRAPTVGGEHVDDQIDKARAYRNALVELERNRRAVYRDIMGQVPAIAAVQTQIDAVVAQIGEIRRAVKQRNMERGERLPDEAARKTIEALKKQAKALRQKRAALCRATLEAANDPTGSVARVRSLSDAIKQEKTAARAKALKAERAKLVREAMDIVPGPTNIPLRVWQVNQRDWAAQKALRAAASSGTLFQVPRARLLPGGLYWGNYLLVEEAMKQSRGDARGDPNFVPSNAWNDHAKASGRIGVQLQKGADKRNGIGVAELFGGANRRVAIVPVDPAAWDVLGTRRTTRRKKSRTVLRLCVQTTGRRSTPIWAEFPMVMHRPLPATARLKWAVVKRERIASRYRWRVLLTIEDVSFASPSAESHPHAQRSAGIDIGWRSRGDKGLRVAYVVANDGSEEEILLPRDIVESLQHADKQQSIRDRNFTAARDWLASWLEENEKRVPEWLRAGTRTLRLWQRSGKLVRIATLWQSRRFAGDDEAYARIVETALPRGPGARKLKVRRTAWYQQERHLYDWQESVRTRARGRRREFYRTTAKRLCASFGHVWREKIDLADLAEHREPEEHVDDALARVYRVAAAPSELLEALTMMAAKSGTIIEEREAAYSTLTCHVCNRRCVFDKRRLRHQCEHCGAVWDQDQNAGSQLQSGDYLANAAAQ